MLTSVLRKLLTVLIIFQVSLGVNPAQAQSPKSAPWQQITPEQMEKLLDSSPELRVQRLAVNTTQDCQLIPDSVERKKCEEKKLHPLSAQATVNSSTSLENKDAAIIVFALVGTVMIVVWIPYVAYLGYLLATKPDEVTTKQILSLNGVAMAKVGNAEGQASGGSFAGSRYSYLLSSKVEPNLAAGLSAEVGYYDLRITDQFESKRQQYGSYWIAGPSVGFTVFQDFMLKLDLLAGRSFDSQLELFTKADITANLAFGKWVFGLGVTGLYFDLAEREGLFNRHSNASVGFTGSVGVSF